jgi:uncharacterized membrane protein
MNRSLTARLAEIIYSLIIGFFGIIHFTNADKMSGIIPDFLPADGRIWIYISGFVLLIASISIIINRSKKTACYLLAIQLVIFAFSMHLESALAGGPGNLFKDIALAMAAIIIGQGASKK